MEECRGGGIPAECLEETVIIAVDFEDLDSLVGRAGLEVSAGREEVTEGGQTYGEAFAVVVQSAVVLGESQYNVAVVVVVGGSMGKLTIMSSWRFDSCVYCWPPPSAVRNR